MIEQCPHCRMALKFSQPHRDKLAAALENLPPGRSLKFSCPGCKRPIELDKSGEPVLRKKDPEAVNTKDAGPDAPAACPVAPPGAPDMSWLEQGEALEEEMPEDMPTAMVLVDDPGLREKVATGLKENQYQIFEPENTDAAVESMRFRAFDVVVFYSRYGGQSFETQDFHRFMAAMSMKKRRKIFYVLLGPEFQTLYDLQALTNSANLVVNPAQAGHFSILVKKGYREYEDLFGPYRTMLKQYGKN